MFQWTKKNIIKSVARELPPRLAVKYGKKDFYNPEEIDWALGAIGKSKDLNYTNYAYGMLTSHSFFMSLGLSTAFGAHPEFHREVGNVLFKQDCAPDFEAYLEYASVHGSTAQYEGNSTQEGLGGWDFGGGDDVGGV
ncbi:TPA: hypothetical protein P0E04_004709 [Vibrio campbellii]|uniref:Bacterial toxin 44 domain-containing protein n=1 Tax=Vibrio campbellii TaxID=680 RepID=A0ABY5I963_9VIBR|nr:hypothetical protein [Vibrio campbellii]RDX38970.1 hypothetical protein DZA52_01665 [Vibrio campbellii]UTZ22014.1 hypothetical protein HB760_08910 [Vibrio campbellii]UTZ30574.1 hypothetical protein HB762_03685 [Vibrio campbellii]HDM8046409.1 hypothetical protein [Vibrio campbellii]